MAIKKTELYSSLWASCDELRGGMDASQYKDYVLTMLFMKYVSDKYKGDPYGMIVVPEGASYDDMIAAKNDKEIGDKINKIISALAEENDLKGVIDVADFNDEDKLGKGKEMVDRLTKLVGIFQGLDLSSNRAGGDDLLGDAYEYLMRHFATESGKSKGQFYTPSEVSQILAKVVGITEDTPQDATVYDPTCGSGSLLLKASDEAPRGLSIFGQEMDVTTSALSKMNMILHGHVSDIRTIAQGNTLSSPAFKNGAVLKTFDFAVANPPFSNKNWTSGLNPEADIYDRFTWGIPPEKNGDYTFLLHITKSLKSTGKGAVILPHGVLFRGNAEATIRENLIKQGYIKGIIGLPANLFYGTGIPACIIVIDKEHAQKAIIESSGSFTEDDAELPTISGRPIFMIDASKGFIKDGNKNRLRSQDIHKIVDVFNKGLELERYSRLVEIDEIAANDYNLNIPRYIDSSEPEDLHDLSAHLQGGIPNRDIDALEHYWQVFPSIRATLFKPEPNPKRNGYSHALVEAGQVKSTILAHQEFKDFAARSLLPFQQWVSEAKLKEIKIGDNPKSFIFTISENLLNSYANSDLLSKYDIYQILMDYWVDTMQDDVYVLVQDDWQAGNTLRELVAKKGETVSSKSKETADLIINKKKYKAEIIPPSLIITQYFADEQAKLDALQAKQDEATQALENYLEEGTSGTGNEDGLLIEALNDKDKITKASVAARAKLATDTEEVKALKQATKLFNAEAAAKKAVKEAQEALNLSVFKQYPKLSIDEIKTLIVDDKWLATLQANIVAEIERVTQQMANRVKQLEERYSTPLPTLSNSVDELSDKVASHLKAMGLEWTL
ncbi:SAM-dependent DNA methyltransferase [Pseudoalteromonas piscicida]|uniref:site-specific DNA-methyltransferase (adenine-specific) n=1 Tax=Pseudoalteromonas piscicida TaxID=43662 RepID=A0AAQ2ISR8_PSEO7|nr:MULTISPECIES: class I SAM-dependent DNA methyltransferase [Pseudoalteromonas]KJY86682.1 type I restriction-modification protein subunit M [Pseudoalteromonas piscicida]TMN36034.1 SAM-dependent DNA methyltransferase [Pseudoalteromonas piscicida]TMN43535.1 SAM-dependent DNA methyltransferase [Pseudoalteromonas piscicida]TMN46399.1 SAM-dependent DNA methyltransferase [Pseudoalteromonas piscicida]TMN51051.1 SAM-dependent DNA methyltransferase [Pseudoalteromonas piscicida]